MCQSSTLRREQNILKMGSCGPESVVVLSRKRGRLRSDVSCLRRKANLVRENETVHEEHFLRSWLSGNEEEEGGDEAKLVKSSRRSARMTAEIRRGRWTRTAASVCVREVSVKETLAGFVGWEICGWFSSVRVCGTCFASVVQVWNRRCRFVVAQRCRNTGDICFVNPGCSEVMSSPLSERFSKSRRHVPHNARWLA